MRKMDDSECTENELYAAGRLPATRDWLHHANQSLSRLKEVKKTSYQLGGGPREREVNCHCNYRTKSKNSYLSLGAEPPQLALDSQETASMPDLPIPEIVKQFNERQLQKNKPKRRPHSSSIYTSSTKSATKVDDRGSKKSSNNYNTFITVKGQTVTPQARPPHGWQPVTDGRKEDASYKGVVYLDQQPVEHQVSTLEGLQRYSAAYGDNEDDLGDIPPPPRVSPEPCSPRTNSPESIDSVKGSLSDDYDNTEAIDNFSETRSLSSAGCRSLVFAIPTAGSEGVSDDEEAIPDEFKPSRLSADYVAKSSALLCELNDKSQAEAAEISDMFQDMKRAKEKISDLRISPRDLELESLTSHSRQGTTSPRPVSGTTTHSVHVLNMEMECSPGAENVSDVSAYCLFETVWVEDPVDGYPPRALPSRNSRVCSARYVSQHAKDTVRVKKHQSESSLVLQGKTMEFFSPEDLAAKTNLRDLRRTSEPHDGLTRLGFTGEEGDMSEKNFRSRKVSTKPPLPKCNSAKNSKIQTSKTKHRSDRKTSETEHQPSKPSLRKSISDGNIHLSVTNSESSTSNNTLKKSVTFSEDVVNQSSIDLDGGNVDNSFDIPELSTSDIIKEETTGECSSKSRLSAHCGVVIQNGLEMKEVDLNADKSPDPVAADQLSRQEHLHQKTQSTRAKILSKMKEIPHEEESCACRSVTRPTAALLAELKNERLGTKEAPSRNEKLLKSRPIRPSSAPIKRQSGVSESKVERPKSPRRKPRAMSATVQRKRTGSDGAHVRPRPSSARVGRVSPNAKDVRRSRAAAQVLKEGYLFKERPPPPLPPERQPKKEVKRVEKEENNNNRNSWIKEKEEVMASEECQEVFARLQEKGIDVSMETIKRGLMAPARKANDYSLISLGKTSGLLSRPENWLPEEHARVQVWDNALKGSK